jgi:hypothetical protein
LAGATIDHLVSLIVLLGALLLFFALFNQTIQTAILYQQHRYLATKCSDLLDNMLLNPGSPLYWGRTNLTLAGFGLQDPEFTQYELSPFSLMRLNYSQTNPSQYSITNMDYSTNTVGPGTSLLVPFNEVINYSAVASLLGTNGTYGFSLTITPILKVDINPTQINPLYLTVTVTGNGYPLANANVSYCLINTTGQAQCPSYDICSNTTTANDDGQAFLDFQNLDGNQTSYAVIVYARSSGLVGTGYYRHALYSDNYVVPMIADFNNQTVILAHSWDVYGGNDQQPIGYNATFVLLTRDFTLREMPLSNASGNISQGTYGTISMLTNDTGILAVSYEKDPLNSGVALMPWGISSLSFPVAFGENPLKNEWVASDIRQVTVDGVAYRATLELWSLTGYEVRS